jgi:hypothetical protein
MDWCERIIDKLNSYYSEDLIDYLSTAMLAMEPESRYSAHACLHRVKELLIPSRGGSLTPTPASYAEEYETTLVGYHAEEHPVEAQPISVGYK